MKWDRKPGSGSAIIYDFKAKFLSKKICSDSKVVKNKAIKLCSLPTTHWKAPIRPFNRKVIEHS